MASVVCVPDAPASDPIAAAAAALGLTPDQLQAAAALLKTLGKQ